MTKKTTALGLVRLLGLGLLSVAGAQTMKTEATLPSGQNVVAQLGRPSLNPLLPPSYHLGEKIDVLVKVRQDTQVSLLLIDPAGRVRPLDNRAVSPSGPQLFSVDSAKLPAGINRLVAVVSAQPLSFAKARLALGATAPVVNNKVPELSVKSPNLAQIAVLIEKGKPAIRDMLPPSQRP